jgi:hypothetical protein
MEVTLTKEAPPLPLQRLIARRLYECAGYQMSPAFADLLAREPLLLAALQRLTLPTAIEPLGKDTNV